jgi:hypothetical protein
LDSDCFGENGLSAVDVAQLQEWAETLDQSGYYFQMPLLTCQGEKQVSKAPQAQRRLMANFPYTLPTTPEPSTLRRILALREEMRGNASPAKHDPDADAVAEAEKYMGDMFVTNDRRIGRRLEAIAGVFFCAPSAMMRFLHADAWDLGDGEIGE